MGTNRPLVDVEMLDPPRSRDRIPSPPPSEISESSVPPPESGLLSIPSVSSLSSSPLPPSRVPPANAESLTDGAAMHKKKGLAAKAAAFRSKRRNYIVSLEETGKATFLESLSVLTLL